MILEIFSPASDKNSPQNLRYPFLSFSATAELVRVAGPSSHYSENAEYADLRIIFFYLPQEPSPVARWEFLDAFHLHFYLDNNVPIVHFYRSSGSMDLS
jgi:hypothetical protein